MKVIDIREKEELIETPLKPLMQKDYEILDLPMSEYDNWKDTINKDDPYGIICRSGNRTSILLQKMKEDGFINVTDMKGGVNAMTGDENCGPCSILADVLKE